MSNYIKSLKSLNTESSSTSVKSAIEKSIKRLENTDMTEKASKHLLTFCTVSLNYKEEFNSDIVTFNVYAVEKAKKIMQAISNNSLTMLDKYTQAVTVNALKRTKSKSLNNHEMNATLSASVICETLTATMTKLHKAASTATTQASSSRIALDCMTIATNDKKAKTVIFNDSELSKKYLQLFKK